MSDLELLFRNFVYEIASVAIILGVALLLSIALKRLVNALRDLKHVSPVIALRLHAVRRWTIILLAVLVVLEALGIFRGAWAFVSTALAALALGFVAAWSVLSNATAALLILVFRPFRIGDEVELLELTNGYPLGGRVLDMNLLYTTLEAEAPTADGTGEQAGDEPQKPLTAQAGSTSPHEQPYLVRIPNNLFFQKPLRTRAAQVMDSKAPFFTRPRS